MEERSTTLPEQAIRAELSAIRAALDRLPERPDRVAVGTVAEVRLALGRIAAAIRTDRDGVAPLRRTGRLTRIEQDPALRSFIDARLGSMAQTDILAACRATFGQERAPSSSGLNRYVHLAAREARRAGK